MRRAEEDDADENREEYERVERRQDGMKRGCLIHLDAAQKPWSVYRVCVRDRKDPSLIPIYPY